MSTVQNGNDRPQRTLIAYCALAERLSKPNSNMFQALVPFFAEACKEFSGELFDASKFSGAVRRSYGIEIPKLAALGIAEQLANEGIRTRNRLFSSLSMAAMALMGRSANGWLEWKTPQGKTLDEVKLQVVKAVD